MEFTYVQNGGYTASTSDVKMIFVEVTGNYIALQKVNVMHPLVAH